MLVDLASSDAFSNIFILVGCLGSKNMSATLMHDQVGLPIMTLVGHIDTRAINIFANLSYKALSGHLCVPQAGTTCAASSQRIQPKIIFS